MKRIGRLAAVAVLLVGCSVITAAQTQCTQGSGGGYDLLQTPSGSTDDLSTIGLGKVTFQGVPLPSVAEVGTADTIVQRQNAIPNPIPQTGACIPIQIVALYLQSTGTVICNNSQCGSYTGQPVTVYATINQVQSIIPTSQLPQYDTLNASTGTMTVFPNYAFNTNGTTIQADLIVVPPGSPVTATKIFSTPMPADSISASGSSWTTTEPAGYPNSPYFPSGGFYVNSFAGSPMFASLITSRIAQGLLYGLGLLLVGISIVKIRSGVASGRLNLRPVYLLGLAAVAWFVAWRSSNFVFPMVAQAKAVCASHSVSVWVNEGGTYVVHVIQTANCSPLSTTATASVGTP
jgi:hypothetical protein